MSPQDRILVAGAETVIGSAIVPVALRRGGCDRLVHDLARPDYVFVAAGRTGGILAAERYAADFCLDNLRVATEIIPAAHRLGVKKLMYFGSSCMYPKLCPQPMRVESLLQGPLEPTCDAYALAKLAE